ncbi:NeuD/PglB/VioB family sugar acetyltransferase [uncultured Enterococcus sp.]|uniref:NeuD/PglB/VioB family sugar acetyltransferase n=1 Tax=uncultured Enterococcus sp. TaxID=167972 RepID=UPI0025906A30|nr:NeuD/PglB/VioB family sugar acetyltransferase [uncultured Enterococcus sp.]
MKIVIVGAGGFAKESAFLVSRLSDFELIGFVDDDTTLAPMILDKPVLGNIDSLLSYSDKIGVAIGIAKLAIKKEIYTKLKANPNLFFPNLIDSTALVGLEVDLGIGNILMPNITYTADISIGNFNMINISSTIGHDSIIGNFNAIYPNVNISGMVKIGDDNEIGVGSKIIQSIKIGNNNIVGAGSVVIRNITNGTKSVGVPTKIIESWD